MITDPQGDNSPQSQTQSTDISKVELERKVVSAIREHRQLFESDQTVYEEWERASNDPKVSPDVVESLQEEYFRRRAITAAQQEQLAELIDILGYVPHVPAEGED